MSGVQHLSMRVPWRDRAWDGFVCKDPINNSSCTLLANIGPKRKDKYEQDRAGMPIESGDLQEHLPCLSERATFMSPTGYSVTKKHPYDWTKALKDRIHPTEVALPGYAFESVPFRWLNRKSLYNEVGLDRVPGFDPGAEDRADAALGWTDANWVMDGSNQRAVIQAFFEPVESGDSLVFVYLKHSPLQEARTDRLLVGAARVGDVGLPPMWNHTGNPPFFSSMWETVLSHSLRPDMVDGIMLPYQQLVPLLDAGVDVDAALAWAPEGRRIEFSYVTEHLSDDAAIEALASLEGAARGMAELGIDLPESALAWVAAQTERLWQMRGPVPGLASVLAHLGVERPFLAARAITGGVDGGDPWPLLESGLADRSTLPSAIGAHLTATIARGWTRLSDLERQELRMLSAFDISADQLAVLMDGPTEVELTPDELLDNPYYASVCTYGQPEHVPFATIDRACFPPPQVEWVPPLPKSGMMDGNTDRRRIEALLTDVLESQGHLGDTVLPEAEALALANALVLTRAPKLTTVVLSGCDLDTDALSERIEEGEWTPIRPVSLVDDSPAFKLSRFEETSEVIRQFVATQESKSSYGAVVDARGVLDESLDRDQRVDTSKPLDDLEEQARTEKAAGLSALHDNPLSVLIGPAGTGKTTLLRVLVEQPGVADGGVLLLAPTGKARVQLETKVGRPAKTLASYLMSSKRYDGDTGRYLVGGTDQPRGSYGLVVIDEASMLTEEMLASTLDSFSGVKRLVLVGDPRQLPPIGAGRPFVDLVDKLRPDDLSGAVRVAAGYVELRVPRRQLPDGSHGQRHDLELAAWYGDGTQGAADDAIWEELRTKPDQPTVRYVPWGDRSPVESLTQALAAELPLDAHEDPTYGFAMTYGATLNGKYLDWEPGAGEEAERWQILSPTRSRAFGTVELNRHIKRTYRTGEVEFARAYRRYNIAKPYGPELIVRGDKVMQTQNRRQTAWTEAKGLSYVANGEIGVAIGRIVAREKRPKAKLKLSVEFSSQPGAQYSYWPTSRDTNIVLELAWAVTVHKSQGSEFGTTFLLLPARVAVSRELMYTALTRQQDKVVILHEGTMQELRDLAQPWRSETARRLTDLFAAPEPVTLELRGQAKRFDRRLMHVSASGIPMASKNEVIIAGLLDQLVPGAWQYEHVLRGKDGREVKPDFTISLPDGRTVFWEHAGMLDVPDYKAKWEKKKQWYADNGVLPHLTGGGPDGTLMWTDDLAGANAKQWLAHASEVLGVAPGSAPATGDDEHRRTAKKTAGRKAER